MPFDWATTGPYAGGTVDFIEVYRGYDIYFLSHWGLQLYGIVDSYGAELDTFAGTLEAARVYIDSLLEGIPTTLTILAPSSVETNESFITSGILYETDTGIPIPNQPINLIYNGNVLGSANTGVDGDYLITANIPTLGSYILTAQFLGTLEMKAAEAKVGIRIGGIEIKSIAIPGIVGIVLMVAILRV